MNVWLQRSYNKYGRKAFVFSVIEYCSEDVLLERERYYIDAARASGEELYNIGSVGGGDNLTLNPNRESIISRMVASLIGRKCEPRYGSDNPHWKGGWKNLRPKCQRCGAMLQGNNKSGFCQNCRTRDGENNPFYGKSHSEETRQRISQKHKGKRNPSCSRPVICDGVWYESVTEAARRLNVSAGTIIFRIKSKYFDYKYA
jgi:group I intron endonuclease